MENHLLYNGNKKKPVSLEFTFKMRLGNFSCRMRSSLFVGLLKKSLFPAYLSCIFLRCALHLNTPLIVQLYREISSKQSPSKPIWSPFLANG